MMTYNVLFLCTGNSARSILAEVLTEHGGNLGRMAVKHRVDRIGHVDTREPTP